MNECFFIGRLCNDPSTRSVGDKTMATFRLAVNRAVKSQTGTDADFFDITAWGKLADFAYTWLKKGMKVVVRCRAENRNYTDKNNVKRYEVRFVAQNIEFGESRKIDETEPNFMDIPDDVDESELPFA